MNTLKNNVSLIGYIGRDPEITNFENENKLARFSIATNESYKNKTGDWVENTTWHTIVAWGKLAERCEKQVKKGTKIILQGKLTQDSYETKEGEKRYKTEVNMREFMLMNRDKDTEETSSTSSKAKEKA